MHPIPTRCPSGSVADSEVAVSSSAWAVRENHLPPVRKARVTQLDIARAAGVHNTTVSLALRNSPFIAEATRQRIQALAGTLGYCPDPALRALVAYRKGLSANRRTETIAYITNREGRWSWRNFSIEEQYFSGAQRKAEECGYQLEHFWLGESDMSARRLSDMLFHRGISAALLASHRSDSRQPLTLEWDRLTVVKLGDVPHAPLVHRVTNDLSGAVRLAMRRGATGFRRVGFVIPETWDRAVDHAWSSSFLLEQNRLPAADRIPPLLQLESTAHTFGAEHSSCVSTESKRRFHQWFETYRPDVILGVYSAARPTLDELGIRVGSDVAFVDLLHDGVTANIAGVCQNCPRVGEVAVEILIGQLQQNLRGIPAIPTTTLIEAIWRQGSSPSASMSPPRMQTAALCRATDSAPAASAA
jgi:LacI family transcriptional regulator